MNVEEIIQSSFVDLYEPTHELGPDYLIPTEEIYTCQPDGVIKIDMSRDADESLKPTSVITFVKKTVDKYPEKVALIVKRNGEMVKWTYQQYWNDIRTVARGFIKLGLQRFKGVAILGFNAPEWMLAYVGAIFSGGIPAGIYTTNSAEASFHILNDSSANIVVVENDIQLQKILKLKDQLPELKAIIQYSGTPKDPSVFSWQDLIKIGESLPDSILERRIKGMAINQCSTLIYTSGTTGNAKGVMLSHDSFLTTVREVAKTMKFIPNEVLLSYLPLSHGAALCSDVYMAIHTAATVYFAPPEALKGKLAETMLEVRPTAFFGVPRVFEKIYEKIVETESRMSPAKRSFMAWARRQVLNYHTSKSKEKTLSFRIAEKLVCKRLRKLIGFDRMRLLMGGGAPLPIEVQKYLTSLDLVIYEGYGLSESGGMVVHNSFDDFRMGSAGKVNVERNNIKIENPDENGNGEILISDRMIFMGYLKLEDKTLECLTNDRWLRSGDIGMIDRDNYLYITGRIKELLITSGGENIPPIPIEEAVQGYLPGISSCILIGDKRKFLSLLLTLKVEINPDTGFATDDLTPAAIQWCRKLGSQANTVSEILKTNDAEVTAEIQAAITKYNNEKAVSNAQRIQKWKILPLDFTIAGGELSPTAKVRRHFVIQKYSELINSMYAD